MRLERRTTEDSSSGRRMRLVPVFTLETNNQTNNECLPKFVQTHNASSSINGQCNQQHFYARNQTNLIQTQWFFKLREEIVWPVTFLLKE